MSDVQSKTNRHAKKQENATHIEGKKNLSIETDAYQTQMLKTADKEYYSDCIPCVEKKHKKVPKQKHKSYPNLNF